MSGLEMVVLLQCCLCGALYRMGGNTHNCGGEMDGVDGMENTDGHR